MMKMGAMYSEAVRLLIVRDYQQPDRLAVHFLRGLSYLVATP